MPCSQNVGHPIQYAIQFAVRRAVATCFRLLRDMGASWHHCGAYGRNPTVNRIKKETP